VPTVQRWRFLKPVPDALAASVPDADTFRAEVLGADPSHWLPAYAKVAGDLPLDEVAAETGSKVLYLQGEVEVSHGDKVTVSLNALDGVRGWLDDRPAPEGATFPVELSTGRHTLTFRVNTAARKARTLRVVVSRPSGSSAEYAVVEGK
jgi:hypothetical protein